jgi:hypothetical protein
MPRARTPYLDRAALRNFKAHAGACTKCGAVDPENQRTLANVCTLGAPILRAALHALALANRKRDARAKRNTGGPAFGREVVQLPAGLERTKARALVAEKFPDNRLERYDARDGRAQIGAIPRDEARP